ncbi:MAG TPA: ATP-binding protein [Mariprofundaceae bacterium]|nr:ATP-binding protein [Mariprofundaceae bacterium]
MLFRSLGVRVATMIVLISGLLLVAGYAWLQTQDRQMVQSEETARAALAAQSLVASLKSIMLAGHGDIAHDWLARVGKVNDFTFAKVYRVNGVEAFHDQKTIKRVNAFIGMDRFHRKWDGTPAGRVPAGLSDAFSDVVSGRDAKRVINAGDHLTYLYPIHVENACLACHGYTSNPLRGVLVLGVSTAGAEAQVAASGRQMMVAFLAVAILLGLGAWLVLRQGVLRPLFRLAGDAERIKTGDLEHRVALNRGDELGALAAAFDDLVTHLRAYIDRQERLTKAVASLSGELASETLIRHIGALAMEITNARYCMMAYIDDGGEKHFVPLGMSDEEIKALGNLPQGVGMLGLLWEEKRTLRLDRLNQHSASVGFPDGHPPMDSFLGTPMMFGGEVIGVIYLTDKLGADSFTQEDEEAIRMLASACGTALSNAKNFEALSHANADLEERVRERTLELTSANQQLKNREIELELMNEELAEASEAKDQFIANTSHELRTPLNAIIGFSELLTSPRAGELSAKQLRYAEHINNSGKRLLDIINNLLDISKIEAGMMEINETSFYPDELGQRVVGELLALAETKSLNLKFMPGAGAHGCVLTDVDKLQHILTNLLGNALKFTPKGGDVELGIDIQASEVGGSVTIAAYVRDTGVGIAPEDIERIFEPFVQAQGGLDRQHGGTGLGLPLCRRLANMLGGEIALESEPGRGSTFFLKMPAFAVDSDQEESALLQQVAEERDEATEILKTTVEEYGPDLTVRPRILVVDDNADRAAVVVQMLNGEGYQGMLVEMDEMCHLAEEICPFLVMLGIPGEAELIYHLLQRLKRCEATRDIPVVLLGGDADSPHFSTGTVDSVEKGLGHQELMDMISRHGRFVPKHPEVHTVLVIDDEESVRDYLKESLVMEGYRILLAPNGKEGLRLAIEREPDLIILDLMMPGMSGFEVMEELHQHPSASDIPVVVYTAKDLTKGDLLRLGQEAERVLVKGASGRPDILHELRKMELLYPVQARLVDPALKCFNRRYLMLRLSQEVGRSKRYNQRFSLVGWQLDGFDAYVQQHGVRWGMAAMKMMTEMARMVTRRADVLARLAENRFVLVLPGISAGAAHRVAEKLRIRISQQIFPLPEGDKGRLTASFGAVHFGLDAEDADTMLEILDARIRQASLAGGDRGMLGEDEHG